MPCHLAKQIYRNTPTFERLKNYNDEEDGDGDADDDHWAGPGNPFAGGGDLCHGDDEEDGGLSGGVQWHHNHSVITIIKLWHPRHQVTFESDLQSSLGAESPIHNLIYKEYPILQVIITGIDIRIICIIIITQRGIGQDYYDHTENQSDDGDADTISIKRDKESLRQKQKEVESMGNRHIKERQNINKVIRDIFEGSLSL